MLFQICILGVFKNIFIFKYGVSTKKKIKKKRIIDYYNYSI